MTQFRPMLGVAVPLKDIHYPVVASPKLDGVRAVGLPGQGLVSRTIKPIPNHALRELFHEFCDRGWDGELVVGDPTAPDVYRRTVSEVMTYEGPSRATWYLFDSILEPNKPWIERFHEQLPQEPLCGGQIRTLEQRAVFSESELLEYEDSVVGKGYEGLILRDPNGRYKYGRSTLREGLLLKLKRFTDTEATVVGFEELFHNVNPATLDERGYTKRSSHQDHKIPADRLGALVVDWQGSLLRIGTGFTTQDRIDIWRNRDNYRGRLAKFKYLPVGMKDLPRHPVFLGWRDPSDT